MDLTPMPTVSIPRQCGPIPCGHCHTCRRRAMLHMAEYAATSKEDPKGVLLDLLNKLGLLPSSV
jgi:hypothetical protein